MWPYRNIDLVNISSGNGFLPDDTNVDLSSVRSSGIRLRTILRDAIAIPHKYNTIATEYKYEQVHLVSE